MIEKGGGIRDGTEGRKVRSKRCDYILKLKNKRFHGFYLDIRYKYNPISVYFEQYEIQFFSFLSHSLNFYFILILQVMRLKGLF